METHLKINHLAPYLPYNIKVLFDNKIEGVLCGISTGLFDLEVIEEFDNGTPIIKSWCYSDTKPILRPLSDLTKEIEINGEKFVPIEWFEIGDDNNETYEYDNGNIRLIEDLEYLSINRLSLDIVFIPYGVIQKLIEWHFDVFSLIDKGLAVDINKL